MFSQHVLTPKAFGNRFAELLPEYLPGMDTGAFEATDRRRCWNKTLKTVLTVMGQDDHGLDVIAQLPAATALKDQSTLQWQRNRAAVFTMMTGWGDRAELDLTLEGLEAFKCPQKLFVYSCSKWQDAVSDQIRAALVRYPYHVEGEQYLFMNLVGPENRLHLLSADIVKNGRQTPELRVVEGSPFRWAVRKQTLVPQTT